MRENLSVLPDSPRAAWRLKKQAAQPCVQGESALDVTAEKIVDENSNSASAIVQAFQVIMHQRSRKRYAQSAQTRQWREQGAGLNLCRQWGQRYGRADFAPHPGDQRNWSIAALKIPRGKEAANARRLGLKAEDAVTQNKGFLQEDRLAVGTWLP